MHEWLPEGHLAHHVSDLVDELDLKAFYTPYEGDGRRNAPYEPRMMVKVLLYGYATGVFSSRGIARRLEEDVAFRVLGAGNFPSHRTLCEFRRRHLEDFRGLFVEVVRVARRMGLARFGKLSVDGTKVRANASKRKAMSYGRMLRRERELEAEIGALLNRARDTDAREDELFGEAFRGDELPEELRRREDRLAAIRAAKEDLEAEQRGADDARGREPGRERNPKGGRPYKRAYGEPDGKAQSNFTDPDSAIMRTSSEGFQQCYNAQVAVDGEHQLIVATELTSNGSDQGALVGLLDEVRDRFDTQPGDGACRRRVLQRAGSVGVGGAGHRRVRGDGARGQTVCGQGCGEAPGDAPHGRKAGHAHGPETVCATQMAVRGTQRLDQGGARLPAVQRAGLGQGTGGMEPGMSGAEHQAVAGAPGNVRAPARQGI